MNFNQVMLKQMESVQKLIVSKLTTPKDLKTILTYVLPTFFRCDVLLIYVPFSLIRKAIGMAVILLDKKDISSV